MKHAVLTNRIISEPKFSVSFAKFSNVLEVVKWWH